MYSLFFLFLKIKFIERKLVVSYHFIRDISQKHVSKFILYVSFHSFPHQYKVVLQLGKSLAEQC